MELDQAKLMRGDLEDAKKRTSGQLSTLSLAVRLQAFIVPAAADFFAQQLQLIHENPSRYCVDARSPPGHVFQVRRRMGPSPTTFTVSLTVDLTTAECTCADRSQRAYVCRHLIAVWLTFPSRSLADFTPLLSLFIARHRVEVARSLVDELWPVLSPGTEAPDPALHQLQFDLAGGSDASSFSPEYRNNLVSSLMQGMSLIAEGLPDDTLSRFAKASWALMAEFSAVSKSRVNQEQSARGAGVPQGNLDDEAASGEDNADGELILRNPAFIGREKTKHLLGVGGKPASKRVSAFDLSERSRSGQRKRIGAYACGNCGVPGHRQATCTAPCRRCGIAGHTNKACKATRARKRKRQESVLFLFKSLGYNISTTRIHKDGHTLTHTEARIHINTHTHTSTRIHIIACRRTHTHTHTYARRYLLMHACRWG